MYDEDLLDERTELLQNRQARRDKRQRELACLGKTIKGFAIVYVSAIIIYLAYFLNTEKKFDYEGRVEDSCQDLAVIQRTNEIIYPLVDQLTYMKFFRIFRVNMANECPFWVGNFICNNRKCTVCECNKQEVPQHWLAPQTDFISQPQVDQAFWDSERDRQVANWVWHVEDKQNDDGIYADLKINPEAFTGYQGQHIWATIYNENCFKGSQWDTMCREERALNKMISGLHASISTQLSEYYIDLVKNRTYANYPLFFEQVGNHPDRLKNLFFLYSVLLRALNLAQPAIEQYQINSQHFIEDVQATKLLQQIYIVTMSQCSHPFDEKQFFSEIKPETKRAYQKYIHNISMIMDCVECEKCKLYGKMQTYGLGTALKILFSDNPEEFLGRIKRNELIAFVNTFAKVSSSVHSVALMFDRRYKYLVNLGYTIVIVMGSFLLFLLCAYKIYAEMGNKVERMFKNLPKDGSGSQKKVKKD